MKKNIILGTFLLFLSSCGYKTAFEANNACEEWIDEGDLIYFERYDIQDGFKTVGMPTRKCGNDQETSQYIGLELEMEYGTKEAPVGDMKYYWPIFGNSRNFIVKKRFRY